MNAYDTGDMVRCSGMFKDTTGALADPTTVTLKLVKPDGTVLTYTYALGEITKDSVGLYHKDLTVASAGYYKYRFEGTGAVQASEQGEFLVLTPVA